MKSKYMVQTFDGKLFESQKDANKHLDKIYGDILLRLARELTGKKYTEVAQYLDEHLEEFVLAKQIKDDTRYQEEEE